MAHHMKPEILGPTEWWKVETTDGTCWVLCEEAGRGDIKATDLLPLLPSRIYDTQDIMRWEFYSGYGARIADATDGNEEWEVFDTERDAKDHLADVDDSLCPMCLGELDGENTCGKCIQGLPHEKFEDALHTVLEGVTVNEVLHTIPGIYEIISEEYNNEALNQAYEEMRLEYETNDQSTQGSSSSGSSTGSTREEGTTKGG